MAPRTAPAFRSVSRRLVVAFLLDCLAEIRRELQQIPHYIFSGLPKLDWRGLPGPIEFQQGDDHRCGVSQDCGEVEQAGHLLNSQS